MSDSTESHDGTFAAEKLVASGSLLESRETNEAGEVRLRWRRDCFGELSHGSRYRLEIEPHQVVHEVEYGLVTDLVGTEQPRPYARAREFGFVPIGSAPTTGATR